MLGTSKAAACRKEEAPRRTLALNASSACSSAAPKCRPAPLVVARQPLNLDSFIDRCLQGRGKRLVQIPETEIQANNLCHCARETFLSQPALLELHAPLQICGDIHGQYQDLLRLFDHGGTPPASNYLFIGDYVDRGKQSIETICLLFAYKVKYGENFFLLRGNHECATVSRQYGFYDECKRRYDVKLWKKFCDVFNCLPACAIVDEKIMCMHGGISQELTDLNQIKRIVRPTDIPETGLLCDLLWADPDEERGFKGWRPSDRGISYTFGTDVLNKFIRKFDIDLIVRAHQVAEDGYEFWGDRNLVTLFSAPNYGGFDNVAGMMLVDETLMCSFKILKPVQEKSDKPERCLPV